jgi:4-alpha-glucanotransferase
MRRRHVMRTSVTELDLWPRNEPILAEPPAGSLAALDTHDLVPFAGYLHGQDIEDRCRIGLIDDHAAALMRAERELVVARLARFLRDQGLLDARVDGPDDLALTDAALRFLGRSEAAIVLVNLEDLWGERLPQNVPGTGQEEPNWRRRARLTLEELSASPGVLATLRRLDERRRAASGP